MQPLSSKYSIKDLERLSGVKAHTIRIWEQRYNLFNPDRTESNIRQYNDHDVRLLLNISTLLSHGCKISHIAKLSLPEISQKVSTLTREIEGTDEYNQIQVDNLILAMLGFDDALFEQTLKQCTDKLGFELTMLNVIIPFLHKVGMMWQTGESTVLQEHFMTNLIRKKILVEIDSIPPTRESLADLYLLFLPEGELHEIGLLFAKYLLKARGKKVLYLGQNVPREDIRIYCKESRPNYLLTFFTAAYSTETINEYLMDLSSWIGSTRLLVAGMQMHLPEIRFPEGVVFIRSVYDLINFCEGRPLHAQTGTNN